MYYIRKWINVGENEDIIWFFIYAERKYPWVKILSIAKGFNTRQEAEAKLVELNLIEDTTLSEKEDTVNIVYIKR